MPEGGATRIGVRWLGHSTVLVELPGLTFLTDPIFRERLGPLRRHGPLPQAGELPPIDVVLLSHAHPDHFDRPSLRLVPGDPLVIVPRGLAPPVTRARRGARTHELAVGDSVELGAWRVTAIHARHWRWPFAWDVPAVGYLVEGAVGIYFAGDTSRFAAMARLAGRVDLALLPVGRWGPQPTPGHLSPRTAARVASTIRARAAIPIHWGTYYPAGLGRVLKGPLHEPGDRFAREAARLAPDVEVRVLEPGRATAFELAPRVAAVKRHRG